MIGINYSELNSNTAAGRLNEKKYFCFLEESRNENNTGRSVRQMKGLINIFPPNSYCIYYIILLTYRYRIVQRSIHRYIVVLCIWPDESGGKLLQYSVVIISHVTREEKIRRKKNYAQQQRPCRTPRTVYNKNYNRTLKYYIKKKQKYYDETYIALLRVARATDN